MSSYARQPPRPAAPPDQEERRAVDDLPPTGRARPTAIVLVPSGAHLFELPGKSGLPRDAYFSVQGIYAGWAWFAVPILAAVLANGALFAAERRRDPPAAWAALLAGALIVVSLAFFFAWVFPANQATAI